MSRLELYTFFYLATKIFEFVHHVTPLICAAVTIHTHCGVSLSNVAY